MIPESEADTIAPGAGGDVVYSEGLETSYRNSRLKAAFPFGHGLTFSGFEYSGLTSVSCEARVPLGATCLQVRVKNVGNATAKAVPQLYLEFPAEAKAPSALLKGFQKTALLRPGDHEVVTFELKPRDMSFYDVVSKGFKVATGTFQVHVGESSTDWRQTFSFCTKGCAGRAPQESLPSLRGRQ
uniref:beta-glucosidase n=1 Tax=Zooxanthella nutricula TaxID=1333877 RepID=A0A7S2JYP7_9DINO|mmetsp:Transcript_38894/g.117483  ORF Transcript_38894/g.117483 Transcript_38894/m.117483 type:complete len:184 (+) Transcript_38894:1-552(+)